MARACGLIARCEWGDEQSKKGAGRTEESASQECVSSVLSVSGSGLRGQEAWCVLVGQTVRLQHSQSQSARLHAV